MNITSSIIKELESDIEKAKNEIRLSKLTDNDESYIYYRGIYDAVSKYYYKYFKKEFMEEN